jgi:hypothetical protein
LSKNPEAWRNISDAEKLGIITGAATGIAEQVLLTKAAEAAGKPVEYWARRYMGAETFGEQVVSRFGLELSLAREAAGDLVKPVVGAVKKVGGAVLEKLPAADEIAEKITSLVGKAKRLFSREEVIGYDVERVKGVSVVSRPGKGGSLEIFTETEFIPVEESSRIGRVMSREELEKSMVGVKASHGKVVVAPELEGMAKPQAVLGLNERIAYMKNPVMWVSRSVEGGEFSRAGSVFGLFEEPYGGTRYGVFDVITFRIGETNKQLPSVLAQLESRLRGGLIDFTHPVTAELKAGYRSAGNLSSLGKLYKRVAAKEGEDAAFNRLVDEVVARNMKTFRLEPGKKIPFRSYSSVELDKPFIVMPGETEAGVVIDWSRNPVFETSRTQSGRFAKTPTRVVERLEALAENAERVAEPGFALKVKETTGVEPSIRINLYDVKEIYTADPLYYLKTGKGGRGGGGGGGPPDVFTGGGEKVKPSMLAEPEATPSGSISVGEPAERTVPKRWGRVSAVQASVEESGLAESVSRSVARLTAVSPSEIAVSVEPV